MHKVQKRQAEPGTFGAKAFRFYTELLHPSALPSELTIIDPYKTALAKNCLEQFLAKFYNDSETRVLVLGINPGRFGGGVTGIHFTDPTALEQYCGIPNSLPKRKELSSDFIYKVVERFGGAHVLYKKFYISAVCPIGFVRNGKNYNYYDDADLYRSLRPYIVESIKSQLSFGASSNVAIVLGAGKNKKILEDINLEYGFFKTIEALEHPRFVMQYRRASVNDYIDKYMTALENTLKRVS